MHEWIDYYHWLKFLKNKQVLLPPAGNVVDVLAQDKRFSILVELLKMSKLADTLQETGPYTVFAPTDEVGILFH